MRSRGAAIIATALLVCAACWLGVASAADAVGYRKAYFAATTPGAWAQYTMKTEGQPDMGYLSRRLPDDAGRQRVQIRIEYMVSGKLTPAFTDYALKPGYSLEADALGFGKALVAMTSSTPGAPPTVMPPAVVDSARKTMPDYAATARFVGTENIGGKVSDHYRYSQKHPGNPAQVESGEIWLSEGVPFGLVKQTAVTAEESGKVVSRFEMLLVDSGAATTAAAVGGNATGAKAGAPTVPMSLAEAFKNGRVELNVRVVADKKDGQNLRIGFKNKTESALRLTIPAGATTLDVGTPLDKLRLRAAAAKTLDLAAGATSEPVELTQTGSRRAVEGAFVLSVYEGTPLFSGNATMGTVAP